ncbi:hypothetical protein R3983_13020, partial [Serratia marcescens]
MLDTLQKIDASSAGTPSNSMVKTKQILVVIHLCSFLVLLYSLSMIPPLLMGLLYKEKSAFSFFYTLVLAATLGGLGWLGTRQSKV